MKAQAVYSGRLRQTVGTVYLFLVLLSFGTTPPPNGTVFQFVAFRIKNAGLWGLDPLILCPFGPFVLTLVFSVRPPQSGVECGEAGCHRFRFERLSFLVHQAVPQAVLRPSQPPSIVRGTLPFFDGFDVVDGPNLRPFINGARMN